MIKTSLVAITVLASILFGTSAFAACNTSSRLFDAEFSIQFVRNPAIDGGAFKSWHIATTSQNRGGGDGGEQLVGENNVITGCNSEGDEATDSDVPTGTMHHFTINVTNTGPSD